MHTLKALIFDFDGTIVDTETPDFLAWRDTFLEFGCTFPEDRIRNSAGSSTQFEPLSYLLENSMFAADIRSVKLFWQGRYEASIAKSIEAAGLRTLLENAREKCLRLAIASSSSRNWIVTHLSRLGLLHWFDFISSGSDVNRVKPYPDVYLHCLAGLQCQPNEVIAFEDSKNGVLASKSADIYTIWIPNDVTRKQEVQIADQTINSFLTLDKVWLSQPFHKSVSIFPGTSKSCGKSG